MPVSPICLAKNGAGPFVSTLNGVDINPGNTASIKLNDTTGVLQWFLRVVGTDELSTPPVLTGVNIITNEVATPSTVVTFSFPAFQGRAFGFESTVTGTGGPNQTTFGLYSLTTFTTRVGFTGETREGDTDYGWATKLNPLIRAGGGGGVDNFSYKTIPVGQTVVIPDNQQMIVLGGINIEGELDIEGELALLEI
jgi:hypothetical protein